MARRSARLQKRSPSPSESSRSSWETAQSEVSHSNERLPSVVEGHEPVAAMKTPQKQKAYKPVKMQSSIPQAHTPKNRTPIKPAGEDMHPAYHHASTAKAMDEARWLGFQALGAHTAPPKAANSYVVGTATPSKTPVPASASKMNILPSPDFKFRFKSAIAGLSPSTKRVLKEGDAKDATPGQRPLFAANEFSAPADVSPRKIAVPKGKTTRFSDLHAAQFKKMDSIANHASAFRADPNRFKLVNTPLKRSPSKPELDKQEPTCKGANKLKRTQSKMDMTEPTPKPPVSKLVATPLKRTQSKMDMSQPNSGLPRAQSSVRMLPPSRDGHPQTQNDSPAKRFKRTESDDAASTRPVFKELPIEPAKPATPARQLHSKSGLPRLNSRLMTPTKSSIARSQSVKTLKTTSMIPSLLRSPSAKALFSPTNIGETMKEGVREGFRKTSSSLHRVRSILRTPSRKFSEDPEKVAAGTHMSPPPGLDLGKALPQIPATAPVRKHVVFTNSTLERAVHDELGKSPSPMKFRAGSEVPSGAIFYPKLQPGVQYPALPEGVEAPTGTPSRRLTFGGATANTPAEFSFKSDKAMDFGPVSSGTIRIVRKSDASSLVEGKKRKLEPSEEPSDKENNEPADESGRSAKKVKMFAGDAPKTPSSVSKLPRRTPKRGSAISKSRLAFLSTPKRSQA
ncbi:hypothetical protein K491DRAFT_628812 [Lophiostoma macrostomum CBS 122681]|uniref:Erythromycin esterase n=1 Tax=Lophiostoma macrostomum CBS 122681 TaxID=1314788 RepID=A0A6A6T8E7_9PLEO|nr:hypothetical protein K491DRAFT_628812 [Lophiostoma macrostomum CBS 122681]